jgi:hypothetical protein
MGMLHTSKQRTTTPRTRTIKVKDVVRHATYELGPDETMLRVPYDLFDPPGPIQYNDDLITYVQSGEVRTGRAAAAQLGDARPGERVLLRIPPCETPREWWLCEVLEVDGVAAD